ncbi:MAG: trimethylamine methyltransferase family protein [Spirochaetota bacterium]
MAIRELKGGQLRYMSEEDMDRIHSAVLEVMNDVGVKVAHKPALEIMKEHGCKVDFEKMTVRIPEYVLRKCLSTAPSSFTLYARDPRFDVRLNQRNVYTIGGSSALFVLDLDGVRRPATLKDLEDLTRLQDALENLHIMHGLVNPQDIPQAGFDRILFAAVMKHTARNYYSQALGAQGVRDQVEMASVIAGDLKKFQERPFFTIVLCMVSPLVHPRIRVEELMECARLSVPVYIEVDAMPGGTTPITVAGTLVEQSANILTGVCLAQMIRPGLPCIYSIASGIMDMRTGGYSPGAPETQLLHAATAQMAHYYGLPCQAGTGIDAVVPDAQAGYERALQFLTCALGGADFVHLCTGMLEQMLTASYELCVMDDEILGAAFRIVKGFEVNSDTIALDVIKKVGIGGNYLGEEHTLEYMRKIIWFPRLTNRAKWDNWLNAGGKDFREAGKHEARRILDTHHPVYLEPKMAEEIGKMAEKFQAIEIEAVRSGKIVY